MKKALILSCSKAKLEEPGPAIQVYDGPMFRILRKYKPHLDVFILSARYGLIPAMHFIEPYDLTLKDVPMKDIVIDAKVQGQQIGINKYYKLKQYSTIHVVMGLDYLRWLLMILKYATIAEGDVALSYFNSLRFPTLECQGNGQMQAELKKICYEQQSDGVVPDWHAILEDTEAKARSYRLEGWLAHRDGKTIEECPYPVCDLGYQSINWFMGWTCRRFATEQDGPYQSLTMVEEQDNSPDEWIFDGIVG